MLLLSCLHISLHLESILVFFSDLTSWYTPHVLQFSGRTKHHRQDTREHECYFYIVMIEYRVMNNEGNKQVV
jgi:hypothetical protein